jgi:glycosyltransferase involved in cell wall biosynthesis
MTGVANTRPSARPRIAFVAEQFTPPVRDGSTYVYKNWIDFLASRFELYAIFFRTYPGGEPEARAYLAEHCRDYLILPGTPDARGWKLARAVLRFASGELLAPQWLEELGRSGIHSEIAAFAARHDLRLFILSKLVSVPLFGERNLKEMKATFLLDMHDDFVMRDEMERKVGAHLFAEIPALASFPAYRDMRMRQRLSRLSMPRARAREARMCRLFDCVLLSSAGDLRSYRSMLDVPCELIGWPPPTRADHCQAVASASPAFDAGFIGANHAFNVEGIVHFCTRVLPLVRQRLPGFRFLVAGKVADPLRHAKQSWPGVEFMGFVPDVRSFYDAVRVCVVPLLSGTGVSLKTLEAVQHGRPVISSPMGARGLAEVGALPGLTIARTDDDFAAEIVSALEHDPARSNKGAASRAVASHDFGDRFARLLQSVTQPNGELPSSGDALLSAAATAK